jgi:hypothetical protein
VEKKGRDGYSIPFIISSQQFLDKTSKQNVDNLIADFVKNSNNEIYISYCMTINDLILGIRDDSKKHIILNLLGKPSSEFLNFIHINGFELSTDKVTILNINGQIVKSLMI